MTRRRSCHAMGPVALVAILVALAAAPPATAAEAGARSDAITVGALLDLRSGWTSLGRASEVTLRLAAADANHRFAASRVPTRVRLKVVDVRGDPARARRELRRLAAQGVRLVIGPQASSEVRAVRTAADSLGVVTISQGSTAHSLAIARDNVFRFVPDDVREGEAVVALLAKDRIDAIVPVWRNDAGNAGLAISVRRQFEKAGGSVTRGIRYGTGVSDFTPVVGELHTQVSALGAARAAVYLAAFDEAAQLFDAASRDPLLASLPWYGSDGVALTPRLLQDPVAARFAAGVGYPNPTLGLDAAAIRRSRRLVARVRAKLGSNPDAFALTAYDALRIAAASIRAAGVDDVRGLKRALVQTAHGYTGVSGRLLLNAAGDRAFGSYDFWSVCLPGGRPVWTRTSSYISERPGKGRIVARASC
ncbi:MAG: ABC transporter substrate-binding protein [Thermoleophilaceae bacterium]